MRKCATCNAELTIPHICNYCRKPFCDEHRLPENHQCPDIPDERFWYQKRVQGQRVEAYAEKRNYRLCPKCGSEYISILSFDEDSGRWACRSCSHHWTQRREKTS